MMDHLFIFGSVFLAVYSQLIIRWQVALAGSLPEGLCGKFSFTFALLTNLWVVSGIAATFLSGLLWILAMTKFEISYAYPYISLTYVLVLGAGFVFFGESVSLSKVAGAILILLGIFVVAKG